MIDKFKATFLEEAGELLGQLEETLLELEDQPTDSELINRAFRAMHTIKGSAAMFGYEGVSRFTHEVESALDRCRSGSLSIDRAFIGLTLRARDHIRHLLDADSPDPRLEEAGRTLLDAYRAYAASGSPPVPESSPPRPEAEASERRTWRILFRPHPDIFRDGTKVLNLLGELSELGELTSYAHMEGIPSLEELDPERCYCSWDILLTTERDLNAIKDVFIFVEGRAELTLSPLSSGHLASNETKKLGEIFVERGLATAEVIGQAVDGQRRLGEVLIENKIISRSEVESALLEQEHLRRVQEKKEGGGSASIRVASDKLDGLVDLVGELVTLQARLSQTALEQQDAGLSSISEQFERLISQLRDNTMSIRMLPIGSTFNKFKRVVRDLSIELGKEVAFATEGADTELDKTVIEKLGDPLVHIIRNSLDHGIEAPQLRSVSGKPREGTIRIAARHSGAYVLIQVSDDGRGLDPEAIRQKGLEKGLIAPGQELSESELFQLIFAPGFSTAKSITTVSGRGVGMDVVRREIDSLGGSVQLDSRPGLGTTVTLKIPLTLAIIEGLLVRIGGEFYVIPLSSVDGCIEITRSELEALGERRILSYREELVPFIPLRGFFASGGPDAEISQIVIAQALEMRIGFVVDQVVGDYQTVIKPLGRMYKDVEGISGATILGDGRVALILDVNRLALTVQRDARGRMLHWSAEA
jgi:two-component system chemotaxis sensor kinase CheA